MVFNLIGAGIFGKTEQDSLEDFKSVYTFQDAFVKPFRPEAKPPRRLFRPPCPRRKLHEWNSARVIQFPAMLNAAD